MGSVSINEKQSIIFSITNLIFQMCFLKIFMMDNALCITARAIIMK